METQTRARAELRPVWTGRDLAQHQAIPRTAPYSAASPLSSATLSAPSPLYPASPGYDYSMRAHERALVDRLDRFDRGRRDSQQSPNTGPLFSPMADHALGARRGSAASLPLPRVPVPSPRSPGVMDFPGSQTLAAQSRSILLDGMHDGLPRPPPVSPVTDRRQSMPAWAAGARRSSQQMRDELRGWGHVYFGNVAITDCFVSAVALRRASERSPTDETTSPAEEAPFGGKNRVTIRARVRPCALDRKPFLLRRTFDMDELRATIPELPPVSAGGQRPSTNRTSRSPLPASRRHSSVTGSAKHGPDLDRSHVQSTNTVPIRKESPPPDPIMILATTADHNLSPPLQQT